MLPQSRRDQLGRVHQLRAVLLQGGIAAACAHLRADKAEVEIHESAEAGQEDPKKFDGVVVGERIMREAQEGDELFISEIIIVNQARWEVMEVILIVPIK